MVSKEFYREVLNCSEDEVWKDPHSLIAKYLWMNLKPNIMLDFVSRKIRNNDLYAAEKQLDNIKLELSEFGENWFLSSIYFALEDELQIKIVPYGIPREYWQHIWYMRNFFGMRKHELSGNKERTRIFRENIVDRNFTDSYKEFNSKFSIEYERMYGKKENRHIQLKKKASRAIKYPLNTLTFIGVLFASIPLLIKDAISLKKLNFAVCPYQRCRYYSEKIRKIKGEELNDSIYNSSVFKKYSLPNFWLDLCTPSEQKKLNALRCEDYSEFDKLAKDYVPIKL